MIQFKDLSFGEWSGDDHFKYREAAAGTDFMEIEVTEYICSGKRAFELRWSGYAFQMEAEYGHDSVSDLKTANAVDEAIKTEVYGRIKWLMEECEKFLKI